MDRRSMEITKTQVDKVEVQYTVIDGEWTYMDTLLLNPKETEEIDKMIDEKYSEWKAYVTTPAVILTKAEEQAKLEAEKTSLEAQLTAVTSKIGSLEKVR